MRANFQKTKKKEEIDLNFHFFCILNNSIVFAGIISNILHVLYVLKIIKAPDALRQLAFLVLPKFKPNTDLLITFLEKQESFL